MDFRYKIKHIYVPYLAATISFAITYSILRWLLDVRWNLLPISPDFLNFYLPILLPWIIIYKYFRKNVNIFIFKNDRHEGRFTTQLLIAISMSATTIAAQFYVTTAGYGLKTINSPDEVVNSEKYYDFDNFGIDTTQFSYKCIKDLSGEHNETTNFYIYVVFPFKQSTTVFYGIKYKSSVDTDKSNAEKNKISKALTERATYDLNNRDLYDVVYFETVGFSDDWDRYFNAIQNKFPEADPRKTQILTPQNKPFEHRTKNSLLWTIAAFLFCSVLVFVVLIFHKIDPIAKKAYENGENLDEDFDDLIRNYLNPFKGLKGTSLLNLISIIYFIVLLLYGINMMTPSVNDLHFIGGKQTNLILQKGEYWRLLSSLIVYNGILHFLFNLLGICFMGYLLEPVIGWKKILVSYILCGILANVASLFYFADTNITSGAQGGLFGLLGVFSILHILKIYKSKKVNYQWNFIALFIIITFFAGYLTKGIENISMIFGVILGIILGYIFLTGNAFKYRKRAAQLFKE